MSGNNTRSAIYLIIIAILLCSTGYFAWKSFNESTEKAEQVEKNEELNAEYQSALSDLQQQELELNNLKGQNSELDSIIVLREQEIQKIKEDLQKYKNSSAFNKAKLNEVKAEIEKIKAENAQFMAKIDSMKATINVLEEEKVVLNETIKTEKEYSAKLEDDKAYLEDKFELGSLLNANNLNASGIKGKKDGGEKTVSKIKNLEEIKVCYSTGQNLARDPGKVIMYMRIETPSGETIYNEQLGSGTFEMANGGGQIRYTKMASFDYDNTDKPVCIYTSYGFTESGTYNIYMYQDGYELGNTSVSFK